MNLGATSKIFNNAGSLRLNPTPAEEKLWEALRKKQLGVRFRRQHPCGPFILDFYSHEVRLAVEVDGEYHNLPEQQARDEERSVFLNDNRISVLRFSNAEVLDQLPDVVKRIRQYLRQLTFGPLQEEAPSLDLAPPPGEREGDL